VAFVEQACGTDPELRQLVDALLQAHERAGQLPGPTLLVAPEQLIGEGPGTVIGRYKLLQEIGQGGFGVVFMAEQLEPVQRKVALKILKPGMDTKEVIARFEAERQALALMDHPNIARVLDAGATESGRPYFVMELVKGIRITDYCDQNDLPTEERLKLFMKVCHAVQHAHQKGIIHRDLKPSNVMVTLHDGEPVPKVIDFGIAKATGQRLTDKTLFTRYEQMIGTPAYMSPEQAAMSGLDVDTRTDIYALGVLLYELLTGVTPFDKETLAKAAFDEIRRLIQEAEPAKPSTRVHALGDKLTDVAKHRQTEPAGLTRQLHGDLDWIVMKALEKDRARRYETANALVEDIQHHLSHEPVRASPPSAAYRAGKFIRRHRLGVAFAAAVVVALALGLVVSLIGFAQARRERDRAVAAEKQAEDEKVRARMVSDFLQNDLLDVEGEPDRELKLRTVVGRAEEKIGSCFAGQALVEASIRLTFGRLHLSVAELEAAELHLVRAAELRTKILGSDSLPVLEARKALGGLRLFQGRFGEAETLYREVLETAERTLGPTNAFSLSARSGFGAALSWRDLKEAAAQYEIALAGQRRTLGEEHEDTIATMSDLARAWQLQGRFTDAEALCEKSSRAAARLWGADALRSLWPRVQLARVYQSAGRGEEARDILEGLIPVYERKLGPAQYDTLLVKLSLAQTLVDLGEFERAEQLIREAADHYRSSLGPTHRRTTDTLRQLAECQWAAGREQASIATVAEVTRLLESAQDSFAAMGPDWLDWEAKQSGKFGYWRPCAALHVRLLTQYRPGDPAVWARGAVATLMNRDLQAYGEVCQGMLRKWNTAADPGTNATLARVLLLIPSEGTQLEAACRPVDSLPVGDGLLPSYPLLRGIADYRRGRWEQAELWLQQVRSTNSHSVCLRDYFAAMVRHQRGDKAGALANLQGANRSLETLLKRGDLGWIWESDGRCVIARIEAERLILGRESSPFPDAVWLLKQRYAKNRPKR
jgi:eukaryotic-like serine/threonine-protein kinase